MKLTEEEKQKMRENGFLIDDILKVSEDIERLGLGDELKQNWERLIIPIRSCIE